MKKRSQREVRRQAASGVFSANDKRVNDRVHLRHGENLYPFAVSGQEFMVRLALRSSDVVSRGILSFSHTACRTRL